MTVEDVIVPGAGVLLVEKRLSTRDRAEAEAAARLRAEGELLGALGGTFTPKLVEAGEDERGPWLRMEKIPFPTLAERLTKAAGSPLDRAWIERAAHAAFSALAKLHDASDSQGPLELVHADVSPANIAIDDEGTRVVLLDLELSAWRGALPRDGAFRGTVAYCAPEIARGEVPTVASDLFGLAATFLHAAAGQPPRSGPSLAALLAVAAENAILEEAHVLAMDLASRGAAHAALLRCLAHEPDERPRSAHEVVRSIAEG